MLYILIKYILYITIVRYISNSIYIYNRFIHIYIYIHYCSKVWGHLEMSLFIRKAQFFQ